MIRSALARSAAVDHDQQLHDVLVHRRAGRLNEKHVAAADVFVDLAGDFAVGKLAERDVAQRHAEVFGDPLRQGRIGGAAEDFEVVHGGRCRCGLADVSGSGVRARIVIG